jgi:hypothetical protein
MTGVQGRALRYEACNNVASREATIGNPAPASRPCVDRNWRAESSTMPGVAYGRIIAWKRKGSFVFWV